MVGLENVDAKLWQVPPLPMCGVFSNEKIDLACGGGGYLDDHKNARRCLHPSLECGSTASVFSETT
eukprot:1829662-Amphidinium_carterae.1